MQNIRCLNLNFFDCITDDMHKGGSDAADKIRITEIARGNPYLQHYC